MKLPRIFLFIPLLFTGCSIVFTGSINGRIVDSELYEKDSDNSGIEEANVFLYTEEKDWQADFETWDEGNGSLPNDASRSDYTYFQSTVTDGDGNYTFNGLIWENLFSSYGKTGDRKQIYLLFYHKNYGLMKNPVPLFIVSNVTNRLDLISLEDRKNNQTISGYVFDSELYPTGSTDETLRDAAAIQGTTVEVYIPDDWDYDSNGNIDDATLNFPSTPTATTQTAADGRYSFDLTYWMKPSRSDNRGTTKLLLRYEAGGYTADPAIDSDFSTSLDVNNDGVTYAAGDTDDIYYLTGAITDEETSLQGERLNDILLIPSNNEVTIEGYLLEGGFAETPVPNANVRLYVPVEQRTSSTPSTDFTGYRYQLVEGETDSYYLYTANPQTTLTTDADGFYSASISYPKMPTPSGDTGHAQFLLNFRQNNFIITPDTDNRLQADLDLDNDGKTWSEDEDADDIYYYSPVLSDEDTVTLATISAEAVETEHRLTLKGTVWNQNASAGEADVNIDIYSPVQYYASVPPIRSDYFFLGNDTDGYYEYSLTPTINGLQSDADGLYETEVIFPLLPDEDNDTGKARFVLAFNKDTFTIDPAIDSDLADLVDFDGDGTDDPCLYTEELTKERVETLPTIDVRQTEFDESLSGRVILSGNGVNGVTVRLYIGYASDPTALATPPSPDLTTTTETIRVAGSETTEAGHFSFEHIVWDENTPESGYEGSQGVVQVWITIDDPGFTTTDQPMTLRSGTTNNIEFEE